jgi:hypothetical protein
VVVGQKCVVDYSAEGPPIVRALTVNQTPIAVGLDEFAFVPEPEIDRSFVSMRYEKIGNPQQQSTNTTFYVRFPSKIWDSHKNSYYDGNAVTPAPYAGIVVPRDGKYLVQTTVAVGESPNQTKMRNISASITVHSNITFAAAILIDSTYNRFTFNGNIVTQLSSLMTLYEGEQVRVRMRGFSTGSFDFVLPQLSGVYPVLELHRMTIMEGNPYSRREWFWYEAFEIP